MKIAFISDIHANLEALRAVLADIAEEGCDMIYCLGDVVGYGPNPNECCTLIRDMGIPTTMGNHDEATADDSCVLGHGANQLATESIRWTRTVISAEHRQWLVGLPFTIDLPDLGAILCHANLHHPEMWGYIETPYDAYLTFQRLRRPVCFFGHTHRSIIISCAGTDGEIEATVAEKAEFSGDARFLINCGSVGQPRDGDHRGCYAIFDTTPIPTVVVRRVAYPKEITQRKILALNLPFRLALRLGSGK